ncbi:hypothetical protein GKE82_07665 [Conexibacter sp. W3-3-2]|nr:hypothetical protein [Conexibacter sp. W3-3-2]
MPPRRRRGRPPRRLRRRPRAQGAPAAARGRARRVSTALPVRAPFDGDALLAWLAARAVPGVEEVDGCRYRRLLGPDVVLELELGRDRAVHHAGPVDAALALTAADEDPAAAGALLRADPALAPLLAARPGLRVPGAVDAAELAVRAVLGQQVSLAAARTLAGRLAVAHGTPRAGSGSPGALTHAFPTPSALAALDPATLPMPRSRGRTVVALAAALADGTLRLDPARPDATRAALLAVPGIGPWTADYVALRALRDRDAFPASDLVLRRTAQALGLPGDARGLLAHAERWRPYRAAAAQHLWAAAAAGPPAPR